MGINEANAKDLPIVKKLETWTTRTASTGQVYDLVGIRLTFSDGHQTPVAGSNNPHHAHESLEFQTDERIHSIFIQRTSYGALRSLYIYTSNHREFWSGSRNTSGADLIRPNVFGGIWLASEMGTWADHLLE